MTIFGKILFYNEHTGKGIIITKKKQKIEFDIVTWSDYDTLPSSGAEVVFESNRDGVIETIETVKVDTIIEKPKPITNTVIKENENHKEDNGQKKDKNQKRETHPKIDEKIKEPSKQTYKAKDVWINNATTELDNLLHDTGDGLKKLSKNISLSSGINDTMKEYFNSLKLKLEKREGYKKVNGRLNFAMAKRFLWTTYNNLIEIDPNILTPRIKAIGNDVKIMSQVKEKFDQKISYPLNAFENIFLASQSEYQFVKEMTKQSSEKLAFLQAKEEKIAQEKREKQQEIDLAISKEDRVSLTEELKVLNGAYVDIVHILARLKEINTINTKRLQDFENRYKEDFFKNFRQESKKHYKNIIEILNAQAYLLDNLLWNAAKVSKTVVNYFKTMDIDTELNTLTYLKYYLSTLDEAKANKETQELFKYCDYLVQIHKDAILLLMSCVQDAMEYAGYIQNISPEFVVKPFISELESLKWAKQNSVKIIILEEQLLTTTAVQYLDYYHQHIFSKPKIILIGNPQQSNLNGYNIKKIVPPNATPKLIYDAIMQISNTD